MSWFPGDTHEYFRGFRGNFNKLVDSSAIIAQLDDKIDRTVRRHQLEIEIQGRLMYSSPLSDDNPSWPVVRPIAMYYKSGCTDRKAVTTLPAASPPPNG